MFNILLALSWLSAGCATTAPAEKPPPQRGILRFLNCRITGSARSGKVDLTQKIREFKKMQKPCSSWLWQF
jgi:hypothetical protein